MVTAQQRFRELSKNLPKPTDPSGSSFRFARAQRVDALVGIESQLKKEGFDTSNIQEFNTITSDERARAQRGSLQEQETARVTDRRQQAQRERTREKLIEREIEKERKKRETNPSQGTPVEVTIPGGSRAVLTLPGRTQGELSETIDGTITSFEVRNLDTGTITTGKRVIRDGKSQLDINTESVVSNNIATPTILENKAEDRVLRSKQAKEEFFSSPGFKRIDQTFSLITGGQGRNVEQRGTVGRLAQKGLVGIATLPQNLFFTTQNVIATGDALVAGRGFTQPRNLVGEFGRAGRETVTTTLNPLTDEGKLTFLFAGTGAVVPAASAGVAARPTNIGATFRGSQNLVVGNLKTGSKVQGVPAQGTLAINPITGVGKGQLTFKPTIFGTERIGIVDITPKQTITRIKKIDPKTGDVLSTKRIVQKTNPKDVIRIKPEELSRSPRNQIEIAPPNPEAPSIFIQQEKIVTGLTGKKTDRTGFKVTDTTLTGRAKTTVGSETAASKKVIVGNTFKTQFDLGTGKLTKEIIGIERQAIAPKFVQEKAKIPADLAEINFDKGGITTFRRVRESRAIRKSARDDVLTFDLDIGTRPVKLSDFGLFRKDKKKSKPFEIESISNIKKIPKKNKKELKVITDGNLQLANPQSKTTKATRVQITELPRVETTDFALKIQLPKARLKQPLSRVTASRSKTRSSLIAGTTTSAATGIDTTSATKQPVATIIDQRTNIGQPSKVRVDNKFDLRTRIGTRTDVATKTDLRTRLQQFSKVGTPIATPEINVRPPRIPIPKTVPPKIPTFDLNLGGNTLEDKLVKRKKTKSKRKFKGTPSLPVLFGFKGQKLTKGQVKGKEFINPFTIREI